MDNSHVAEASLPALPPQARHSIIGTTRRRMAVVISLVIGLVMFFLWLPGEAWAGLIAALRAQQVLVGMLLVFAMIAVSLVWSAGQRLDTWIFLLLNVRGYHPKWLDIFMNLATQLGNMVTAFLLAGLFFVMGNRPLSAEVILGALTLWLLVETVKALTDRARPFLDLEATRVIGWRERGRSFPSGHTAQAFFLVTLLGSQSRLGLGLGGTVTLYVIAALVGFTRMYVGAHYPRDVIGGAVLGSVWGILATLVDPYWLGRWS